MAGSTNGKSRAVVGDMQHVLGVPDTEVIDAPTVAALAAWQRARGLPATGDLDDRTFSALFPRGWPPPEGPVAAGGSKGSLYVGLGLAALVALFLWKR